MSDQSKLPEWQLCEALLEFSGTIDELESAEQMLNGLHVVTSEHVALNVLGAFILPSRWGDMGDVEMGRTVFLHKSAPKGWWEEYLHLSRQHLSPGYAAIHLAMAAFSMTEAMKMLEPLGVDRWGIDLHHKYGMRDVLSCPVGGRWVVVFWSSDVLTRRLTPRLRALLMMGATTVAIRLQQVARARPGASNGKASLLTPREISVLRNLSTGKPIAEIAELLGLSQETIRTHLKKAQTKLGVRTQSHAVAQAMRQGYVP